MGITRLVSGKRACSCYGSKLPNTKALRIRVAVLGKPDGIKTSTKGPRPIVNRPSRFRACFRVMALTRAIHGEALVVLATTYDLLVRLMQQDRLGKG